jgi:hypothetical protein
MHGASNERLDHVASSSGDRELERRSILDSLGPSTCAMHGRRVPGARVDLDDVLVAPTGVFTIEARDTTARMDPQANQLWVGHRSRARYLDQARDQADAVRHILEGAGLVEVPVIPTLCFAAVQWPLLFAPQQPGPVRVVDIRGLADLADGAAVLTDAQVWQVVDVLDRHLDALQDDDAPPTTITARPAHDALGSTADADAREPDQRDADADALVVSHWKQAGKQRLYVARADGTPLGFVDLRTQAVVPDDPRHHDLVREAASKHLQDP